MHEKRELKKANQHTNPSIKQSLDQPLNTAQIDANQSDNDIQWVRIEVSSPSLHSPSSHCNKIWAVLFTLHQT